MSFFKWLAIGLCFISLLFIPGPAGPIGANPAFAWVGDDVENEATPAGPQVNDPLQGVNRSVFQFNDKLYFWAVKPAATVYASVVPKEQRENVKSAYDNFVTPARFVNDVLQHKGERADIEAKRFIINSTLGVGGLFDIAQSRFGMAKPPKEDFGQTLGAWGVETGPFLMVPVLGPSDARDLFGYAVDSAMDPLEWIPLAVWVNPTIKAGKIMNSASLKLGVYEDFKQSALDPYLSMRDGYLQHREKEINQ